jgi:hypothetical protein
MAIRFYKDVVAQAGSNVVLTGHSMGAGHAGLVGALFGKEAVIFDNVPFQLAAQRVYDLATNNLTGIILPWGLSRDDIVSLVYGSDTPWAPSFNQITNYYVSNYELGPQTNWLAFLRSLGRTAGNGQTKGDANANVLEGGAGNDSLTGAAGNDTFVFHAGFGKDTIVDFVAGVGAGDVIQFDQALFADFAAVLSHAQQVGANTVVTFDTNNTITLNAITLSNLASDDFRFIWSVEVALAPSSTYGGPPFSGAVGPGEGWSTCRWRSIFAIYDALQGP